MDPVTKALIDNIKNVPTPAIMKEVKCEVCNIMVSSYLYFKTIFYRKHKNQLKLRIRTKSINLKCVICNHLSKNPAEWELHVTSELHVENAKKYKPLPIPATTVVQNTEPAQSTSQSENPIQQENTKIIPPLMPPEELIRLTHNFEKKENEKALRKILSKSKKEWQCVNCNVTCQSKCSWEAHLASKKHKKRNEFIEDGVIFYCKRCDVRMQTKLQLEVHMSSNQHKMNHPIAPVPVANPFPSYPVQNNPQLFNFESSSYGYGFRNWNGEQYMFNAKQANVSYSELQKQQEEERERQLVEKAKNELLARFPFYAINQINSENNSSSPDQQVWLPPENIPLPVEAPQPVEPPAVFNVSTSRQ
ncbi:CLUMA_CG010980, isoform A [Clunio marinus]|uniref:CLUMA_CG010980, isoform A n=1 Tax=Clunio marinus TaxID=568069 RepID=A0A1J1ICW9_9DIPT|nr:CLUMA_CG010980, isoform A [Clunio marinus]